MFAAMLHGTTRRNNNIQVLKGVCRVIVCTAGPRLQGHRIGFSNHFHLFGFDVQVLLFNFLFYFMLLQETHAATLHRTPSLSILLSRVFCLFCLCVMRAMRFAAAGRTGLRGVHGKPSTGRCAQRRFRGVPGPGRGDT